jgi:hypothetical protein
MKGLRLSFFSMVLMLLAVKGVAATAARNVRDLRMPIGVDSQRSNWPISLYYSVSSDFADSRDPRGYMNSVGGSVSYFINDKWSLNSGLGIRGEFVDGQIQKEAQQTYSETLYPTGSLSASYSNAITDEQSYSVSLHAEPFFDEPSRREGYQSMVGIRGVHSVSFFTKKFNLIQSLDSSELIGTFKHDSSGNTNPDLYLTYGMSGSYRFLNSYQFAYTFSLRATRYLDGFVGYAYDNYITLSRSWKQLTVAGTYSNGGFTEKGEVTFWYLDQYRRIVRLAIQYTF